MLFHLPQYYAFETNILGITSSQSVQNSSTSPEFFDKKNQLLEIHCCTFFLRAKGAESLFFQAIWGGKSPKYQFFGRISNVVK